jgi:general nucleoside transport system permease protein
MSARGGEPRGRRHDAGRRHRRLCHLRAHGQRPVLAFAAGAAAGALLAAVFGVLVIWLNTNQYATGLAVEPVRRRLLGLCRHRYVRQEAAGARLRSIPGSGRLPLCRAAALFKQHPMVYGAVSADRGAGLVLVQSRAGLVLRAVGESPESAHALGYAVRRIRLAGRDGGGRAVRRGRGLPVGGLHAAVGRRAWWRAKVGSRWR